MADISVRQISKKFENHQAVDNVSFEAVSGRIFGLLGPNGAGKTTTIRMINNILYPDSGEILVKGEKVGPNTQSLVGYMPEERGLYKKMKVGEQLLYLIRLKGLSHKDAVAAAKYWLERFDAYEWKDKMISELSKGMSQKIQFIATIAHDPGILIFDEPFSGLDPINSELLKNIIIELKDNGKTIFFSTHRMEQVEQMCDDICLFNRGKAILNGELRTIKKSFGTNTVELDFHGDGAFLDKIPNIRINNKASNHAEIRLLEDTTHRDVLEAAMAAVDITRFELVEPSLNEIFISTVGVDNLNAEEKAALGALS
jgi:ABC-2 type transport system ATP-binding protein